MAEKIAFEKYFTGIYDGEIIACQKMKRISEMLLERYACPDEYHFDYMLANRPVEFIEKFCYVPAGRIGEPLKLELFQKARIQALFGFVDDNDMRQYNECNIIEGRKNGKTTEVAAIELFMLAGDGEGGAEIYNVATKLDQAKKGFNAACNMRQQSPLLRKHIRKRAADLWFSKTMSFIKALASNTSSLDSLDAHCATVDELAAIKNRDLYDLMKQSMGGRNQPILFTISTNGFLRNGIFDAQYNYAKGVLDGKIKNKKFLPFIYELDDPEEWTDPKMWVKANPGLGTIKKTAYLKEMVEKGLDDPAFKPTVLVKDFNVPQTSNKAWLEWDELNNERISSKQYDYAIGGFDAADTTDLNFAVAICQRPDDPEIVVHAMSWIPEEVLKKIERTGIRTERDHAPYTLWVEQGYMRTCPGHKCDKRIFLEWFKELRDDHDLNVVFIGYDPWHIDDTLLREFKMEFGENAMIPIRQGVRTLSQPMKDLKAEFREHNIVYQNHPVLKWCLVNTIAKTDVNGNIQPVKTDDELMRIDGTIALLCAYVVLIDNRDKYINLN